jgi:hypothetical protein
VPEAATAWVRNLIGRGRDKLEIARVQFPYSATRRNGSCPRPFRPIGRVRRGVFNAAPSTLEGTMRSRGRLTLVMAMAMLAVAVGAVAASADVDRYQYTDYEITVEVNEVADYTHVFFVRYDPGDDSYSGTGSVPALGIDEELSNFEMNGNRLSFDALYTTGPNIGYIWYPAFILGDEPDLVFDGSGPGVNPATTSGTYTVTDKEYKNHGQYVKEAEDKKEAAHSLIGMPTQSNKKKNK